MGSGVVGPDRTGTHIHTPTDEATNPNGWWPERPFFVSRRYTHGRVVPVDVRVSLRGLVRTRQTLGIPVALSWVLTVTTFVLSGV